MGIKLTINRVCGINYVKIDNGESYISIAVDSLVPLNVDDILLTILGMWDIPSYDVYQAYVPEENSKQKYKQLKDQATFFNDFIGKEYLEMIAGEVGWYNGITQNR